MAVDRFGLPLDDDEVVQQMTNVFTVPTTFEKCMTIEEQLLYLELTKQDRLVAGENVTLTRNDDHTVTISVSGVGKTYRIAEVTPDEGYVAAYALVEVETGVISGSKIQIPEPGTGVTPVITATASVDSATGTPSVQVVKTGTDEAPNFAFNFHNLKGQAGQNGQNGNDGAPGYSPSANIQQTATGAVVTITDEFGTTQAEISNGSDGAPGQSGADGVSPTANVQSITGGARITITDANGTTTQDVMDGTDGSDGDDGVGIASIAFKETDASGNNVYTITLTNNNTYDFTANRGPQGLQGPQGIPGSGADGVGISNITFDHEDASGNYVYLVTLSNNQTYTFTAPRGPQGLQGIQGIQGNPGQTGSPGADGVSPTANVQSITGGARITITDANGTTTADVMDGAAGQNGQNGAPGYSPTASIQQTANGATITITDENGTTTATITNGQNGSNGVGISGITFKETDANGNNVYTVTLTDSSTYDITCPKGAAGTNGISPSASVAAITGGARITITDANGTTTQDVMDGATGQTGPAGPGVPSGGTDGQVLTKDGSTDYATKWATPSGGGGVTVTDTVFDNASTQGVTVERYRDSDGSWISETPNARIKIHTVMSGNDLVDFDFYGIDGYPGSYATYHKGRVGMLNVSNYSSYIRIKFPTSIQLTNNQILRTGLFGINTYDLLTPSGRYLVRYETGYFVIYLHFQSTPPSASTHAFYYLLD